jgi:hypothetical protein
MNVNFHGSNTGVYRGLCMAPNGEVLSVPYTNGGSSGIVRVDPRVDPMTFSTISVGGLAPSSGNTGWIAAALAANGKILMSTSEQAQLVTVDTTDPTWPVTGINIGGVGAHQQRCVCLGADGNWWTAPWVNTFVRRINPTTNATTMFDVHYQDHSHPSAQTISNADWNRPSNATQSSRYWGIVPGPGRLMFGIPYTAERVLVINPDAAGTPSDPVAYQAGGVNGLVTGNYWNEAQDSQWYYPNGSLIPSVSSHSVSNKYSGGTFCVFTNKIICMPRMSPAILAINPLLAPAFGEDSPAGFITEIPLPKDNVDFNYNAAGGNSSNYFGSAHLADGRIISVPWNNHKVVIWNGRSQTFHFHTIEELAPANATGNVGITYNFYTSGLLLPDGRTIFSPFQANKYMTVDLGPGKTLTRDNLLQRWINRSL